MTEFKIVPSESKHKVFLCLVGIFSVGSIGCIGLTMGLLYHYGKYINTYLMIYCLSRIRKKTDIRSLSSETFLPAITQKFGGVCSKHDSAKMYMYLRILFVVHFCRVFPFSQFFLLEEHVVYKYDTFYNMLLYDNYLG